MVSKTAVMKQSGKIVKVEVSLDKVVKKLL